MRDYLLGLATIPGIAAGAVLLYGFAWLAVRITRAAVRRIPPDSGHNRAALAAAVAVTRRVHMLRLGYDIAIVLGSRRRGDADDSRYHRVYGAVVGAMRTTTPPTEDQ